MRWSCNEYESVPQRLRKPPKDETQPNHVPRVRYSRKRDSRSTERRSFVPDWLRLWHVFKAAFDYPTGRGTRQQGNIGPVSQSTGRGNSVHWLRGVGYWNGHHANAVLGA